MTIAVQLAVTGRRLFVAAALVVSLVPAWAQDTAAATVISMTGRVSVLRDSAPWGLNVGSVVMPKQIILTGPDGVARFQVSDGSTFDVFPNSRVIFRDNPPSWKDLVDVLLGRIKVHIEKLNGMPNHNRVMTPTAVISVRGTTFDVAIEDDDDTTLVSVEEGEVGVRNKVLGGEVSLHPGEWVRVFKNQALAQRQVDRGGVVQGVLRAGAQALYDLLYRRQAAGPAGTGGAPVPTAGNGDHDKTSGSGTPAPAPAPPPPPPPPPQ
jgi:hypothetical protein